MEADTTLHRIADALRAVVAQAETPEAIELRQRIIERIEARIAIPDYPDLPTLEELTR